MSPLSALPRFKIWGCRGSIACPGEAYQVYGGNTSCIEVRIGSHLLIFDAGTGLRELGVSLAAEIAAGGAAAKPETIDIFLTHTHLDHIVGLPFFAALFDEATRVRMWAGHLEARQKTLHQVMCHFMAAPLFPIPPAAFRAKVSYHDFVAGETLEPLPGLLLATCRLNHPGGATAYRLDRNGHGFCYVTDTEHRKGRPDEAILSLVDRAEIMIYDATYTDEEYPRHVDWGHSTWQEGVRLAELASVRRLVLFHHDPGHDDGMMAEIEAAAAARRPGTLAARDGMILEL